MPKEIDQYIAEFDPETQKVLKELRKIKAKVPTSQFPLSESLPSDLVRRMVAFRVGEVLGRPSR